MTREEAIKNLEKLENLFTIAADQNTTIDYSKIIETLKFAIIAMSPYTTKQINKAWRGYWDDTSDKNDRGKKLYCSICGNRASRYVAGNDYWDFIEPNFCPSCGAVMEDGVEKIVKKRLEAMRDEAD